MAPSKKTCTVLMVDVSSPSMTPHLGWVGDSLSRVVQSRILHARADEFALVTCGARETKNDVHTEGLENATAANEQDYEEDYVNISVDVAMACACHETSGVVSQLESLAGDGAPCDYLDALTVASDVLVRHERGGGFNRKVLFVTDLKTPCDIDDDFLNSIAAGMRGTSVQLVVAIVDADYSDETTNVNKTMFQSLCDSLNVSADGVTPVSTALRSSIQDAQTVFAHDQTKQTRPTTTFRGDLKITPWMSVKVWGYKKISEAKPPSMKLYDASATDPDGEGPMVTRERTFTSYADPDNPKDVPPEMMLSAYPYGPTNIPIQDDVAALVSSKNDKGMDVFGFTPLTSVPPWYGMEEARVLVPHPSKAGSAAAGMAASAGTSNREAGKAAAAMSALARAMKRKGVAALTRAVWTQNSDKVSFGALTPHITPEGDFLVFTPLPYAEDAYSAEFKPLVTESVAHAKLGDGSKKTKKAHAIAPDNTQRAAAAALVDALDGAGVDPWSVLNPALARTHALLHARSIDEFAAPLAEAKGGGPAAVAALLAPPIAEAKGAPPVGGAALAETRATAAASAAAVFTAACGGLGGGEPRLAGTRRAEHELPAAAPSVPNEGTAPDFAPTDPVDDAPPAQRRRTGPEPPATRVSSDGDGWVKIKDEPLSTMQIDTVRMETLPVNGLDDLDNDDVGDDDAVPETSVPANTAEDDGFFDDME